MKDKKLINHQFIDNFLIFLIQKLITGVLFLTIIKK